MQIRELIAAIDLNQSIEEQAKPKVKPDGKGGFVDANTGQPAAPDNTVPFPGQSSSQKAAPPTSNQGGMNISYQNKPVDNKPANLMTPNPAAQPQQGKMNISYPNQTIPTQQAAPAASGQTTGTPAAPAPNKFSKAWDATKKGAAALGQGVKKYGPGLAKGAANLATGTAKFAGDLAAQTAGGVAQTVGSIPGGFAKGYRTSRGGGQFTADPVSSGGSAGSSELAGLKAMISKLDQRLSNIETQPPEAKFTSMAENRNRRRIRVVR